MSILQKILKKRGIEDVNELDLEEREQFEQWRKTLSEDEISLDSVKDFCETQVRNIEAQMKDLERSTEKTDRLVTQHTVYKSIIGIIEAPQEMKENLIKYLQGLL